MIAGVVLAAGGSSRLGRPKQLLELGGAPPLVTRTATTMIAAGCDPVLVVLGAHEQAVRTALIGVEVETVVNADWKLGMAGSIRRGVGALLHRPEVEGVVLTVSDQPALSVEIVTRLIDTFRADPRRRVGSRYAETLGVPALFGREVFPELMRLQGDRGAKSLLIGHALAVGVPWDDGALDLDEPSDIDPQPGPRGPAA